MGSVYIILFFLQRALSSDCRVNIQYIYNISDDKHTEKISPSCYAARNRQACVQMNDIST
ncbi:MAG: hypothetical protein D3904_14095 [Candidatus Electrothrix sp. EH2]|nr:hypothetical protein [Candidatus Electrothrix sp. EH2]